MSTSLKKLIETAKKYYGILEKSNISLFNAFGDQSSKVGVFDELLAQYNSETEDDDWMLTHSSDINVAFMVEDGLENKISADIEVMKIKISNPESNSAISTLVKMLDICAKAMTGIFPVETARKYYEKIASDYKSKMGAHDPQTEFLTVAEEVLDIAAKKAQARREQAHKAEQALHDKITQLQQELVLQQQQSAQANRTQEQLLALERERALKIQQQLHDQLKQTEQTLASQKSTSETSILALNEALITEREQTQMVTADLESRFGHLQKAYATLNDTHSALSFRYSKNHAEMSRHIAESTQILDEVKKLQIQLNNAETQHQKTTDHLKVARQDFAILQNQHNDAFTEYNEVYEDINNMSVSLDTLTKEKASQKVVIDDLTNRVTRLTESMLAKEDLIKQLEETNRELESKLQTAASISLRQQELLQALEAKLQQSTSKNTELQQALSAANRTEVTKDGTISSLEAQIESFHDQISELQEHNRKPATVTGKHGTNRNCVFSGSDVKKQKTAIIREGNPITQRITVKV